MYSQAFESAVNHAMLYEVGDDWNVNNEGVIDGSNPRNCGYTNDANDPGGETKFGLSKNENPNLDIANLTWDQAKAAYYSLYWLSGHCDKLPGRIAALQFDGNVNNGVGESAKFLQRAVGADADGDIGPATLATVAKFDPIAVCNAICDQRAAYYHDIVARKPSQAMYIDGWMRRVNEMRTFSTNPSANF
jgi:lysozyme family protein